MADLDMGTSEILAAQLTTINHPYGAIALTATANDLVDWCKGAIIAGRVWTPAEQAASLVREARTTFSNWEKAGGTTALLALFRAMFPKSCEANPNWKPLSYEQMLAKGLVRPPCESCDGNLYLGEIPNLRYCAKCGEGRANAKWNGEAGLYRFNHPPVERPRPTRDFSTVVSITPEQMARALEDEQRRRQEQFQRVGVD